MVGKNLTFWLSIIISLTTIVYGVSLSYTFKHRNVSTSVAYTFCTGVQVFSRHSNKTITQCEFEHDCVHCNLYVPRNVTRQLVERKLSFSMEYGLGKNFVRYGCQGYGENIVCYVTNCQGITDNPSYGTGEGVVCSNGIDDCFVCSVFYPKEYPILDRSEFIGAVVRPKKRGVRQVSNGSSALFCFMAPIIAVFVWLRNEAFNSVTTVGAICGPTSTVCGSTSTVSTRFYVSPSLFGKICAAFRARFLVYLSRQKVRVRNVVFGDNWTLVPKFTIPALISFLKTCVFINLVDSMYRRVYAAACRYVEPDVRNFDRVPSRVEISTLVVWLTTTEMARLPPLTYTDVIRRRREDHFIESTVPRLPVQGVGAVIRSLSSEEDSITGQLRPMTYAEATRQDHSNLYDDGSISGVVRRRMRAVIAGVHRVVRDNPVEIARRMLSDTVRLADEALVRAYGDDVLYVHEMTTAEMRARNMVDSTDDDIEEETGVEYFGDDPVEGNNGVDSAREPFDPVYATFAKEKMNELSVIARPLLRRIEQLSQAVQAMRVHLLPMSLIERASYMTQLTREYSDINAYYHKLVDQHSLYVDIYHSFLSFEDITNVTSYIYTCQLRISIMAAFFEKSYSRMGQSLVDLYVESDLIETLPSLMDALTSIIRYRRDIKLMLEEKTTPILFGFYQFLTVRLYDVKELSFGDVEMPRTSFPEKRVRSLIRGYFRYLEKQRRMRSILNDFVWSDSDYAYKLLKARRKLNTDSTPKTCQKWWPDLPFIGGRAAEM